MTRPWVRTLARAVSEGLVAAVRTASRTSSPTTGGRRSPRPGRASAPRPGGPVPAAGYPGDFTGTARVEYDPQDDGDADPGEVVWGWVPYEEDHSRGKDRPALVVGRESRWVLALMLTSKDHDGTGRSDGRDWLDVGTGAWDSRGRPSEVRLDRVLRLDPDGIRREGGRLDRATFDTVARALRERYGWD